MKITAFALLLILSVTPSKAQDSQTGFNFLRLPVSAHAAAIGGDNITMIEDDEALIFNNPSLLSSVSDKSINLNFMHYMRGANMASAAFNRNIGEHASWALSAQYLDYGKMKEVDADNVQTGEFNAKDISLAGYFSYMLAEKLAGGIAMKVITSYIGDYNSIAMGVDLGLNYYDSDHRYDKMPLDVQLGVSKQLTSTPIRYSATIVDMNHWNYKLIDHLIVGADAYLSESFWIGLGYNFRRAHEMRIFDTSGEAKSHGAGFSMGAGLNLERFKLNLAYGKYHVSNNSIIINIAYTL